MQKSVLLGARPWLVGANGLVGVSAIEWGRGSANTVPPWHYSVGSCRFEAFMNHAMLSEDVEFAVVLAAWWRLRHSSYLLPHLRRGPSPFAFHPGHAAVSWIMTIAVEPAMLVVCHVPWTNRPAQALPPWVDPPTDPRGVAVVPPAHPHGSSGGDGRGPAGPVLPPTPSRSSSAARGSRS